MCQNYSNMGPKLLQNGTPEGPGAPLGGQGALEALLGIFVHGFWALLGGTMAAKELPREAQDCSRGSKTSPGHPWSGQRAPQNGP